MFFKKKKVKEMAADAIKSLNEAQALPSKSEAELDFEKKVEYVVKYLSRNRIESPRKGIFVNRELVHKLHDYVQIIGQGEASIGAYVEEIILDHLNRNKDTIDALFHISSDLRR